MLLFSLFTKLTRSENSMGVSHLFPISSLFRVRNKIHNTLFGCFCKVCYDFLKSNTIKRVMQDLIFFKKIFNWITILDSYCKFLNNFSFWIIF